MSSTPFNPLPQMHSVVLPLQLSLPRLPLSPRLWWYGPVNGINRSSLPRLTRWLRIESIRRGYPPPCKLLMLGTFSRPMSQTLLRALPQMPLGVKVYNLTLGRRISKPVPPLLATLHTPHLPTA